MTAKPKAQDCQAQGPRLPRPNFLSLILPLRKPCGTTRGTEALRGPTLPPPHPRLMLQPPASPDSHTPPFSLTLFNSIQESCF